MDSTNWSGKCIPEPFCRCCVCQGKKCLMWHPGHSCKERRAGICPVCGGWDYKCDMYGHIRLGNGNAKSTTNGGADNNS